MLKKWWRRISLRIQGNPEQRADAHTEEPQAASESTQQQSRSHGAAGAPLQWIRRWFKRCVSPTRKFDPNDYLHRLAEQTLLSLSDQKIREEEQQYIQEHLSPSQPSDNSPDPQIFGAQLERWRKVQEQKRQRIKELLKFPQLSDHPSDPQAVAAQLESNPKLQEQLSYLVNYTPSRWLVEREIPEIVELRKSRMAQADNGLQEPRIPPTDTEVSPQDDPYEWMYKNSVTGVCFSGGGIRSATFNLGILQGLAQHEHSNGKPFLEQIDYLSTVSGGGYIHEWLAAWIKRRGLQEVKEQLIPLPEKDCPTFQPATLRWLRRYSNYLTPRKGLFSTDTWVAFAIWLRNTFLNQIVLVSLLLVFLLLPHLLDRGGLSPIIASATNAYSFIAGLRQYCASIDGAGSGLRSRLFCWVINGAPSLFYRVGNALIDLAHLSPVHYLLTLLVSLLSSKASLSIICFLGAVVIMARSCYAAHRYSIADCETVRKGKRRGGGQDTAITIVFLFLLSALFLSRSISNLGTNAKDGNTIYWVVFLLILAGNITVALAGGTVHWFDILNYSDLKKLRWRSRIWAWLKSYGGLVLLFPAVASGGATVLFVLLRWLIFSPHLQSVPGFEDNPWRFVIVVGPPLFLAVPFFSQVLLAGLIGRDFADATREWLARVRAWSLLIACAWLAWFGIALLGATLIKYLFTTTGKATNITWTAIASWVLTTAGSLLAANSGKTSGTNKDSSKAALALNTIAVVGPYFFIAGLLLILAWVDDKALNALSGVWASAVYVLPVLLLVLFGLRVDINEFSMAPFYRNRLSRCYLGASNTSRRPNPLTGFDECDVNRMELSNFRPQGKGKEKYEGPFPIFCTTLNLTFGENLAWQDRKAASFAFTPLYSGYHVSWTSKRDKGKLSYNGYVPTNSYAYPQGGINIATAVAISGAAVSPNWGYHTNPATAFLMAMFNVRLGWWLRNPRTSSMAGSVVPEKPKYDPNELPSPRFPALQLTEEMLGQVNDASDFVYLTDGGHFENMGLYELIRRRCRYIVVCDAEEDHDYCFEGFGSAIRRCRVDFGVEIEVDLSPLRPQMDTQLGYAISTQHFAIGNIRYPERSGKKADEQGKILYIKSSLTGQKRIPYEPGDIVNHKLHHAAFPNDSTLNQWFDEQTFESYRRLGLHIAEEISECKMWSQVFP